MSEENERGEEGENGEENEKSEAGEGGLEESFFGEQSFRFTKDITEVADNVDFDDFHQSYIIYGEGYTFESVCSSILDFSAGEELEWLGELRRIYSGEQEEEGGEGEEFTSYSDTKIKRAHEEGKAAAAAQSAHEQRRRSVFVHSSPTHFPDITRIRKSAFGSIFLRTTGNVQEEVALLKSVADNSYTLLQSLLNTFDKIISSPYTDEERRVKALQNRESLLKTLELHGISKTYSDGNIVWNIYPITHNYLFSLQIGDQLHESRYLSRIEDRILSGPAQKHGLPYEWPTDSVWTGCWDSMGMAGQGSYIMPHGVSYNGKMRDGMFHDNDAMLTYPSQFKALQCVYENGILQDCQFQFADLLMHEKENWEYCQFPDRRFWSEVRKGLKPAKMAQKTEEDPPRIVPPNCYDTGDGFYDPVTLMLFNENKELLRVPVCAEDHWIKKHCRSGFFEYANFRPEFYEDWFDYDENIIQSILKEQENYRNHKITYDDLQQFYADLELLPPRSKFKKRKSPSEIELEEKLKSIPSPGRLTNRKTRERPGHGIASSFFTEKEEEKETVKSDREESLSFVQDVKDSFSTKYTVGSKSVQYKKREIPEKYLKFQPVLRQAFDSKVAFIPRPSEPEIRRRKCRSTKSSSSSFGIFMQGEKSTSKIDIWERKSLEKYSKRLIMEIVNGILEKERERHKRRLHWGRKPQPKPSDRTKPVTKSEKCLKVLDELFSSIPGKFEYCDSDPKKVCDLKEFAEDKYHMVQYWGTRIFNLDFDEYQ